MTNPKQIVEVWCPGEGNSHNDCYRLGKNGITSITLLHTTFKNQPPESIIVIEQGDTTRHLNPRQITEIVWAKHPIQ